MLHPWPGAAHVKLQVHKSAATLMNEEAGHLLLLTSLNTDGFHMAIDQAVRTDGVTAEQPSQRTVGKHTQLTFGRKGSSSIVLRSSMAFHG